MAYSRQSSLLGQLKVSDPKDIDKDMCLHTYVIELPGVKAEAVKIRVNEGRFLIIEAQGRKETVSHLEAERERMWKRSRKEMEENEMKFQEEMKERNRKLREEIEEIDRQHQEQDKRNKETTKHLKEMVERQKKKIQEELENRMSQGEPTFSFGPFARRVGYPFLHPTSYYMSSAFQQAYYGGNNTYHQFPAAVHSAGMMYTLPQFQNSVPSSSFPPAAAIPSPASTYFSFQSHGQVQGQQHSGFRQDQQQQYYGNFGYPNLFPYQTDLTRTPAATNPWFSGSTI